MTRASERCNFDHIKNYAKGSQISQLSQSRFQYPLRISKGYPMVLLTIGIGINENRTLPPKQYSLEFSVQIVFWLQTANVSTVFYLYQISTGILSCDIYV